MTSFIGEKVISGIGITWLVNKADSNAIMISKQFGTIAGCNNTK
jgi:hypothetical protein